MLRKLIIYDLKASAKIFFLFHLVFLIACGLGRFCFMDRIDFVHSSPETLLASVTIIICLAIILVVAVNLFSWLMTAFRFYRNLFGKEGYLSWTLPVSGIRHLWAKIISGCVLMWIDTIVIWLGIFFLVSGRNVTEAYAMISADVTEMLGLPLSMFSLYMFLFTALSCIISVIMTYFCIAVGQLFPSHRILCAIATYFILTFVLQIAVFLIMILSGYFNDYINSSGIFSKELSLILVPSFLFSFIIAIAEYMITHYILSKKINLI